MKVEDYLFVNEVTKEEVFEAIETKQMLLSAEKAFLKNSKIDVPNLSNKLNDSVENQQNDLNNVKESINKEGANITKPLRVMVSNVRKEKGLPENHSDRVISSSQIQKNNNQCSIM
jgi:hypothetical protein